MSERAHTARAVAALGDRVAMVEPSRELWQPDRHEQLAAIEILLASSIDLELRSMLRRREQDLATRRVA